ncbi:uncharacterized protein PV06_05164 [Exophiala oligosperma]|uniref:RNA polymerase I-specific transcription initiation factor RRN6-like protein n=1 Tax=Exophiala oligosperma TaxID=215243 RepID=A0A0D2DNP8_9EURO|nr:uncharacterized protein PV06_05164 [Exophiala oligosperma]KIW44130.1 hypothetical protein PV06_05164 [Exophiala oligosperma]
MADRGREWRLRHSHETKALSYGHFGTATYDSRTQTWSFLRQNYLRQDNKGDGFCPNATGFYLVDERVAIAQESTSTRLTDTLNLSRPVGRTALLKQIPDAAFLPRSLFTSQVLHDVDFDRTVLGDTLALGTARVSLRKSLQHDSPSCMALVFRAGPSGDICLTEVGGEDITLSVEPNSEISCKIPSVALDRGSRMISTEPVRHISSAGTLSGRFLVVRDSGTSVFELLWRQGRFAQAETDNSSHINAAFVDHSLLFSIPSTRTGQAAHAHASFQASSQDILAIVDVRGQWSIWEIRRKRSTSAPVPYHAILKCSKNISDALSEHSLFLADNWHRISWLPDAGGTGQRIMVCNRRSAVVFDSDGTFEGQVDMRLGPQSNETQILDVRTSIIRPYLVLALTSSRILVFTSQGLGQQQSSKYEPLKLVCSWAHFRHGSDLNLRMSVVEFEQDICMLLYSPRSEIAVTYHFRHEPLDPETVAFQAPAIFNLPTEIRKRMGSITDISLQPIKLDTDLATPKPSYHLMKLVASTYQGTIIEAVYKHQFAQSEGGQARTEIPRMSLPHKSVVSTALVAVSDLADLGDFIVGDDEEERQRPEIEDTEQSLTLSVSQPPSHTRDWRAIFEYSRFLPPDHATLPFVDTLGMAIRHFERLQLQERRRPLQVLSQLVSQHQISDVEHDSEATTMWTEELARRDDLRLDSVGLDGLSALSSEQNLLYLYQLGLLTYVASLGENVTDRNRVNRERLVRHIVGDVFLGNIVVRSINTTNQFLEPALPSSPPEPLSDDTRTTTPLPAATPSLAAEEEPTVTRLRSYVSFREKVSPFQASDQENISNILAHLPDSIDEAPANYSYQNTNQRLKLVQEEAAAQSLDPTERRKAERQAARLQKKLEKSIRLGQEILSQRNVLPGINSIGRGVGMPGREVQSSQPAVGGFSQGPSQSQGIPGLTMTQPERGAFGTRPSKSKSKGKDKGSKRKAGF